MANQGGTAGVALAADTAAGACQGEFSQPECAVSFAAKTEKPIRLLLVEDDSTEAELIRTYLRRAGLPMEIRLARSLSEARQFVDDDIDVALLDFNLPDGQALSLLHGTGSHSW
jgi:PleD family two-component response regulator